MAELRTKIAWRKSCGGDRGAHSHSNFTVSREGIWVERSAELEGCCGETRDEVQRVR
jgi:hypothetical protein